MRRMRLTVGLLATAGAFAFAAAPALAAEFEASKAGAEAGASLATKGVGVEELVFHSGPVNTSKGIEHFTVKCQKAKTTGTATDGLSTTLVDNVAFSKCTSGKKGAPVAEKGAVLELKYNSDGAVEIGEIKFKLAEAKCLMTVEAQEVNEGNVHSATFENVTKEKKTGKTITVVKGIRIANNLKKLEMEYEPIKEGHGICAALTEEETEAGNFKGTLEDEVVEGNLLVSAL